MRMRVGVVAICLVLSGCFARSEFEEFAYQGCVKEGKYPNKICSCNAKNLNAMLTDDEKRLYKKAALGDLASSFAAFGFMGKLTNALQKCAD